MRPIHPLPARIAELQPKKVVGVQVDVNGYEVELECGHRSWWAIQPPTDTASCSKCLDELVEKLRKRRVIE